MARARNIKPGFFLNDQLAQVPPLGRLLFAGLWCLADRKGRLENRPVKIKAQILPYDNCDCEALLGELEKHGFIERYEVDGNCFIQIVKFEQHQNPHVKEADSTLPAPKKHSASTGNAGTSRADSLLLIPDSPIPHVDTAARKRGAHALPDDFVLSPAILAWCKQHDLDQPQASLDYMRDWAKSGDKRKADWEATLRNCIKGDWGDARKKARDRARTPGAAPQSIAPDCRISGCKREGIQSLGGVCEVHYAQSRPVGDAKPLGAFLPKVAA